MCASSTPTSLPQCPLIPQIDPQCFCFKSGEGREKKISGSLHLSEEEVSPRVAFFKPSVAHEPFFLRA